MNVGQHSNGMVATEPTWLKGNITSAHCHLNAKDTCILDLWKLLDYLSKAELFVLKVSEMLRRWQPF